MSFSTSFDNRDLTDAELGCLREKIELYQRLGITRTMWVTIACELRLPYLSVKRMGDEMVQRDPFWNLSAYEQCVESEFDDAPDLDRQGMVNDRDFGPPQKKHRVCSDEDNLAGSSASVPDPAIGTGDVPAMMGRRCSSWEWGGGLNRAEANNLLHFLAISSALPYQRSYRRRRRTSSSFREN